MFGGDRWRGAIYARVTDRKQRGEFFSGECFWPWVQLWPASAIPHVRFCTHSEKKVRPSQLAALYLYQFRPGDRCERRQRSWFQPLSMCPTKPLRCRHLSWGTCDGASSSGLLAARRRCGRWPRVRNNRQGGSTRSDTTPSLPGSERPVSSRRSKMACEAWATALARMSPSNTASPTATWNGCPRLRWNWSGSGSTSSSPGPIRRRWRP